MTPKQEAFVREYLIDLNATQAAIRAGYSAHTAEQQGCRLLVNVQVEQAISKAQAKTAHRAQVTVDDHLAQLKEIRDAALAGGKFAAAATCEMARGKVLGFYVEKVQVEDVTDRAAQMRQRREKRLGSAR